MFHSHDASIGTVAASSSLPHQRTKSLPLTSLSLNSLHRNMLEKPHATPPEVQHLPSPPDITASGHLTTLQVMDVICKMAAAVVEPRHSECCHSFALSDGRKRSRTESPTRRGDDLQYDDVTVVATSSSTSASEDNLLRYVRGIRRDRWRWRDEETSQRPALAMFPRAQMSVGPEGERLRICKRVGGLELLEALLVGLEGVDGTKVANRATF